MRAKFGSIGFRFRFIFRGFSFGSILGAVLLFAALAASGQTAPANLSFDVASIKPSPPLDMTKLAAQIQAGKMPNFGIHINAARAEYNYMSLKDLIAAAYKVKPYQITGPDWLGTEHFDIVATIPEGASKDDAPAMLQALLKERFKLVAHRDTQEHPVLALVVAKGGPKMKQSAAAPAPLDEDAPLKPGEMKIDLPDGSGSARVTRNPDGSSIVNMGAKGTITQKMDMQSQTLHLDSTMVTMEGFADMLTNVMQMGGTGGRQVVDMTELKGNYEVALDISLADLMAAARAQGVNVPGPAGGADPSAGSLPADPGGGTTVFDSVQKLGLKLEPRKANVEQLVVDSAEKIPTEN